MRQALHVRALLDIIDRVVCRAASIPALRNIHVREIDYTDEGEPSVLLSATEVAALLITPSETRPDHFMLIRTLADGSYTTLARRCPRDEVAELVIRKLYRRGET